MRADDQGPSGPARPAPSGMAWILPNAVEMEQVQPCLVQFGTELTRICERARARSAGEDNLGAVEPVAVLSMRLVRNRDDDRRRAKRSQQLGLRDDRFEDAAIRPAGPGRQQPDALAGEGQGRAQACTTFCSIAPKIEWWLASFSSTRTTSPGFMKGVLGAPSAMVSIMRISAMQL